jgi:hypothetical protein
VNEVECLEWCVEGTAEFWMESITLNRQNEAVARQTRK